MLNLEGRTGLEPVPFLLTRQAHLPLDAPGPHHLTYSVIKDHTTLAGPAGFEPAVSALTTQRGRPDSPITPKNWLQGRESNPQQSGYEPDDLPLIYPASVSAKNRSMGNPAVRVFICLLCGCASTPAAQPL